jgi:mono/diheme cytochrome c family protein
MELMAAVIVALGILSSSCTAQEARKPRQELEISLPDSRVSRLSAEQLKAHLSARSLVLPNAPAYEGITLAFTVVPMSDLLSAEYARENLSVVFECLDGFAATIPASKVLAKSGDGPRAFLAIEDPRAPWPSLKKHPGATAGPFYLVWTSSATSRRVPEDWPYQIRRVVVKATEDTFRGISPDSTAGTNASIVAGFHVFVRNCSACHTLNGVGESHMGPDLNVPMNPTEYFKNGIFERYVRNPESVVRWEGKRMPSFPADVMTDAELADLRAYLEYMAPRKTLQRSGAAENSVKPEGP